jgi:hypothetical protein
MWVKGAPLHFIVDSASQKNLISTEVVKRLDFPMTPHPQLYTIGWLCQGRDLCVKQQCHLPYDIKPFKDEVLCDISPLEVCDVLLGQGVLPYSQVFNEGSNMISLVPGEGFLPTQFCSRSKFETRHISKSFDENQVHEF